jgi:aspartyl protease family protein
MPRFCSMSETFGTVGLLATAALFVATAGGTAYGLKHRDQVHNFVAHIAGLPLTKSVGADIDGGTDGNETNEPSGEATSEVTLRASDAGHFETSAEINGRSVDVLVDTGATLVALTYEDAERAGIYPRPSEFTQSVSTANGITKVAPVDIDSVSIGNITVHNVRGAVTERGKLQRTLLGMTFLGKLRVEMRKNVLVLRD